jgi:hypothetical protein
MKGRQRVRGFCFLERHVGALLRTTVLIRSLSYGFSSKDFRSLLALLVSEESSASTPRSLTSDQRCFRLHGLIAWISQNFATRSPSSDDTPRFSEREFTTKFPTWCGSRYFGARLAQQCPWPGFEELDHTLEKKCEQEGSLRAIN